MFKLNKACLECNPVRFGLTLLVFFALYGALILPVKAGEDNPGGVGKKEDVHQENEYNKAEQDSDNISLKISDIGREGRKEFMQFLRSGSADAIERRINIIRKKGSEETRWTLYAFFCGALAVERKLPRRRMLLVHLLRGLEDPSQRNRYKARDRLLDSLTLYLYEEDFTEKAKELLAEAIEKNGMKSELILLTGIAKMKRYYPEYGKMAAKVLKPEKRRAESWEHRYADELYGPKEWAAALVLARAGEKKWVKAVVEEAEEEPKYRHTSVDVWWDMAYIRQAAGVEFLRKLVNDEEKFKDRYPSRKIASKAKDPLEKILRGYPVRRLSTKLSEAREWLNAQEGEWEFYTSASQWPEDWKSFPAR